ncbi:MAG: hypothetical protein JXR83_18220 [Deltaproteobacteria bacterium]|nr:hypothetical protein [Deltaproteobacteria bacterium]
MRQLQQKLARAGWVAAWTLLLAAGVRAAPNSDGDLDQALRAGIEANFAGDYDAATAIFERSRAAFADHPAPDFYLATVLFWRNNVDPSNPRHDAAIVRFLDSSIAKAEERLRRDRDDVEALHYLGLGYTYRGRLKAHRGQVYAGGVDGETGRDHLQRAIALCEKDPAAAPRRALGNPCEDVYFPFGAYAYYAGRLPRFLKLLNFLWFVPRGTTEEGLAALERARSHSDLHRLGAASLLADIYLLFEPGGAPRALQISSELASRFPDNPFIDLEQAQILAAAGQHSAALERANGILGKAARGVRNYDRVVELGARLVQAEVALAQNRLADADAVLVALRRDPGNLDNSLTPRLALDQGMLADLRGQRAAALAFYREAIAYKGRAWNRQAAKTAERYLEQPYRNPAARES